MGIEVETDLMLFAITLLGVALFSLCNLRVFSLCANRLGLVDKPNKRKLHSGNVPLIGGLSVFLTVIITATLLLGMTSETIAVILSFTLMVATGVLDDRFDLSVRLRIVIQLISSTILVLGANINIESLGNILALGDLNLGVFSAPFTVLAIMAAMNAYNMIDGIDGLLGSLATITFIGLAVLAYLSNNNVVFVISLLMVFSLIPFLVHNLQIFRVPKVFMGDAGSMFIGLIIIWLMVLVLNPSLQFDYQLKLMPIDSEGMTIRPVAMLWLITIPLMDMLGIMTRRVLKKQNPFKPDRDHLHHIFMRAGFSAREALLIISAAAIFWMFVGIALEYLKLQEFLVLAIYIGVFGVYLYCLTHAWKVVSLVRQLRFGL